MLAYQLNPLTFRCDASVAASPYDIPYITRTPAECGALCTAPTCRSFSWLYTTQECYLSASASPDVDPERYSVWLTPKPGGGSRCDDDLATCDLERSRLRGELDDCHEDGDEERQRLEGELADCKANNSGGGGGTGDICAPGEWLEYEANGYTYRIGCGMVSGANPGGWDLGAATSPAHCMWLCARNDNCVYGVYSHTSCQASAQVRELPTEGVNSPNSGIYRVGPGGNGLETKIPSGEAAYDWCPKISNSRADAVGARWLLLCTSNRPATSTVIAKYAIRDFNLCQQECIKNTACTIVSWSLDRPSGEECFITSHYRGNWAAVPSERSIRADILARL
ncbi:hypothetical protein BDV26DRAFT_296470 [Aspergillus bertholletiae]|uniref:Apple domain-containing protein n=1 Tax=Aspergillus bertholletiae TaxID=1226010 RepID=A0A5N7AY00_9EURO|nr:hypothetical protein BDV26DRAFT_296470 [Aspergillus bertholletiae]